ncbi:Hypothetical predicted protein [Paramuricea clavata]|uniref:Uncharacterized protein n=1 Tax=Paramuricea clavata TaxID=317549 RepID=A0A6S7JW91_PARCT|nr:Hypothetical predicted protein [Paramuricea clavata]
MADLLLQKELSSDERFRLLVTNVPVEMAGEKPPANLSKVGITLSTRRRLTSTGSNEAYSSSQARSMPRACITFPVNRVDANRLLVDKIIPTFRRVCWRKKFRPFPQEHG